ncbi:MAG: precorrin-6y C5,15-methyltransferase (decarboxylating) subunit CbiE [Sporichthyaceae bacterium]
MTVLVVGIGADGWDGLSGPGRTAIASADAIVGSERQLAYLPDALPGLRVPLPKGLQQNLPPLLETFTGLQVCVLASGDPMFYGIGSTLVRLLGPDAVQIVQHPGSVSLACARLRWNQEDVLVRSAVGRPLDRLRSDLFPGARILVLSSGAATPDLVCELLAEAGYGASRLWVLEQLDGPAERIVAGSASDLKAPDGTFDALNVVAIEAVSTADPVARTGLPDEAFEHDGQLTKREIRSVTLARLVPLPGQLLWDVGGGAGSIGIEWMRAAPGARAVAVERNADRAQRIGRNATRLGVPELQVVVGEAPAALLGLPAPDAVFVGGGGSDPVVLQLCFDALQPGGRMVVNAVTLETEAVVIEHAARLGGDLVRLEISRAVPIGRFTGWQSAHPVTQWTVQK